MVPHISVCFCTFQRARYLSGLLRSLERQETNGRFTFSVVVADNDRLRSAEPVVRESSRALALEVTYCVEPQQNIALARNRALAHAKGEFIAFIDDDEFPEPDWLLRLYETCEQSGAAGVLGPVLPRFAGEPPAWVIKGRFCDRPRHATGTQIGWKEGRTGNLLLRRNLIPQSEPVFRAQYGSGGEDRDFFRRMIGNGNRFVWCDEAVVHEWVPPGRWKRSFMLRRALLRGKVSLNHRKGPWGVMSSLVAIMAYILVLPVMFIMGNHFVMKFLIKICDHSGRLLALLGLNPVRETYLTE